MAADISVGVEIIDRQHQDLLEQLVRILERARTSVAAEALLPALDDLEQSVGAHFKTEEDLMREHRFSGQAVHKECHESFVRTFIELKSKLPGLVAGRERAEHIDALVHGWLLLHIEGYDKILGNFLVAAGVD